MLCYLAGIEPYYLKCINDGPFQPSTADGDDKSESQWTPDERRVVVQDQRLKSIIMSCLPDDIMKSVVRCETVKATWTDLVHSFEENSDDEVDERSSEEYLRDLDIEFHERALLSSQNSISQADPKIQKDYKAEYQKIKAKLALLEANPSTSHNPKTFQPKNKGLVDETFDWDEEEVSDNEEVT
uniref:Retrovirus-related Pol polyprotein from transposon TNT 1-94 n=1 Tax=Tanacetum cinerariifolium TaxID=118510 RepID=A0A699H8Z6_TANCI|nr:retrovirus-related Pol polyprotein from transposon TNT 1-94 [Tanacetum cinerariifolium]